VLTGFMGTGKTTVGRLLAAALGYELVDTDVLIEQRHGPIPAIFAERGEEGFRAIERAVTAELAPRRGLVIATGGRLMLDPHNAELLGAGADVFCLVASPDEIYERVTADRSRLERPLLAVPDPRRRIHELLSDREALYRRFPQVDTDHRTPEAVVDELLTLLATAQHTR
jgi:shikimate kinase